MSRYFQQDIMGEHVSFSMNEYRRIIIVGQHHEGTDKKKCALCMECRAQWAKEARQRRQTRHVPSSRLNPDRERFYVCEH